MTETNPSPVVRRRVAILVALLFGTAVLTLALRDRSSYPSAETIVGGAKPTADGAPSGAADPTVPAGHEPGPSTADSSRAPVTSSPEDNGPARATAAMEDEFLGSAKPGATEVARGTLPDGRSKWRLHVYPDQGSYCLALSSFVYEPRPGVPFKSSSSTGCDYPEPMAVTGNTVAQHGILWFGAVNPAASRLGGRVSGGAEVQATMSSLERFGRKAFVLLLPDETGLHEFVATDDTGREVGRTAYANTASH